MANQEPRLEGKKVGQVDGIHLKERNSVTVLSTSSPRQVDRDDAGNSNTAASPLTFLCWGMRDGRKLTLRGRQSPQLLTEAETGLHHYHLCLLGPRFPNKEPGREQEGVG